MRRFVLLAHEVPLDGEISLDDLPGTGGRLDVIARSVSTALLLSRGIRRDCTVDVVVRDECTIRLAGADLRQLHPDERSTAALLRDAIGAREDAVGALPAEPHPGVSVYRRGLAETLEALSVPVVQLHEDGRSLEDGLPTEAAFVLSDHLPYAPEDDRTLEAVGAERVRLGPRPLHTAHAVAVTHHYLDTDGYARL